MSTLWLTASPPIAYLVVSAKRLGSLAEPI
jgi:hypothetical protein